MIVVTGGLGFIGSALVKKLNNLGHKNIFIVDRFRSGEKWKNIQSCQIKDFVHADDFFQSSLVDEVTEVYHLGACSATTEYNVDYLMKNNYQFSQQMYKWAQKKGRSFVYASSAATYGDGDNGYDDDHSQIHNLRPLNPYGYSKHLFDTWLLSEASTSCKWAGLKFFNVYGPNEYHKESMRSVIFHSYYQFKKENKVKLFKSYLPEYKHGEQKRDFIYVKDAVRCMVALMEKIKEDSNNSGIYNIGTGKAHTFNELIQALFQSLGKGPKIEYTEMPEHLKNKYQYYTQANMSKFHRVVPDFHFTSLANNVHDYISKYLENDQSYIDFE